LTEDKTALVFLLVSGLFIISAPIAGKLVGKSVSSLYVTCCMNTGLCVYKTVPGILCFIHFFIIVISNLFHNQQFHPLLHRFIFEHFRFKEI